MAYRLPGEKEIISAIVLCMVEHNTVHSQRELGRLVRSILSRDATEEFLVSDRRIRKIAIANGLVKLELRYRDAELKNGKFCPICGQRLRRTRNWTLDGKKVALGISCDRCGYRSGRRGSLPARYIFHARKDSRIAREIVSSGGISQM